MADRFANFECNKWVMAHKAALHMKIYQWQTNILNRRHPYLGPQRLRAWERTEQIVAILASKFLRSQK